MTQNVIKLGKRQWAVGMTWRSFEQRPTRIELREDATELKANLAAVRLTAQSRQAGFMASADGDKNRPHGVYSLAAAIADAREQPWLGIFRVADDLWWYIAVREGQAILPDGDVIGDQNTILAARARHESFTDWNYVKGDAADLLSLIDGQGKKLRLVPVQSLEPVSLVLPILSITAVSLLLLGGGLWWHHYQVVQQQEHAARIAAERAKIAAEAAAISPLVKSPLPGVWLSACESKIATTPLTIANWSLTAVACSTTAATTTWHRNDGATVLARPNGAIDTTGDQIVQTIPIAPSDIPNGPDNGAGLPASNLALLAILQPLGITPHISMSMTPPPLPGASSPSQTPPIPKEDVTFTLPLDPTTLPFNRVPGLRLTGLTIDTDNNWNLTGTIYGH